MVHRVKDMLYFPIAWYFALFARIRLMRWKPRIVVITGSNGKTTALHMVEVRLGTSARYSHHRNSSFGIPFDILDLEDASRSHFAWFKLAFQAPFHAFYRVPSEKIYVVEADCDRPGEGKFLSELLKPEVVVWLDCARTHSVRFEHRVHDGTFTNVDDAIAYEYGYFLQQAKHLCIINADDARIVRQMSRSRAKRLGITERDLQTYSVSTAGTEFGLYGARYSFMHLLPKEVFRAIAASASVAQYFGIQPTNDVSRFSPPPGRSSILRGIKNTILIDSSYNINVASLNAILSMVEQLSGTKWMIFGDMTEQGTYEAEEHERAALLVAQAGFDRVFLVGPRSRNHVLPILREHGVPTESYLDPAEVRDALPHAIEGGEILVFKGARFLEAIVEEMLADKKDAKKLCRREDVWHARRAQWGL